jgi:hypothetical protein
VRVSPKAVLRARLALLAVVLAWFFSPPAWRYEVPLWLPFVLALGLELEFLVGGLLRPRSEPVARDRGPQPVDLERFGWAGEEPEEDDPTFWTSPPARRRRVPLARRVAASLVVIGLVALAAWGISVRRGWSALDNGTQTRIEHVLSQQAQRIAGHPVSVRCDIKGTHVGSVQEADGEAEVGGRNAWLTPGICYRLYKLIDHNDTHSFNATGRAVAVLAHESWHLQGVADEGVANCYAFQSGVGIGVRLGLSSSRARALMREQLATNDFDSSGAPQYVVPAGCRDGGLYDLDRASTRFP